MARLLERSVKILGEPCKDLASIGAETLLLYAMLHQAGGLVGGYVYEKDMQALAANLAGATSLT